MAKKKAKKPVKGKAKKATKPAAREKRLYRSKSDKVLGGVCGGLAKYLGVDPIIIRLIWAVATLGYGIGLLAYILAWIIIPQEP